MCIVRPCKFDYNHNRNFIYKLRKDYPFAEYAVIGRSLSGRAIFSLSIGTGDTKVLYAGGFHGQEWLTSLILFKFFENLCDAYNTDSTISALKMPSCLEGRKLTIIPCVNPDGIEIAQHGSAAANAYQPLVDKIANGDFSNWNANSRGVDINHNFDAGWEELREIEKKNGILGPSPRQYGGSAPESEPETSALVRLCKSAEFHHAFAIHSQGEEIYWQYGENTPPESLMMARILSASSGYTLVSNEGLSSHGGFKDWFIEEMNQPAFTIEIGKGKNPLPVSLFDEIYEHLEEMLILGAIM